MSDRKRVDHRFDRPRAPPLPPPLQRRRARAAEPMTTALAIRHQDPSGLYRPCACNQTSSSAHCQSSAPPSGVTASSGDDSSLSW